MLAGMARDAPAEGGLTMPQWAYMRWRVQSFHSQDACLAGITDAAVREGARSLSRMLEQAGEAEGELVSAAPLGQGGVGVLFFKRPKAEG